MYVLLWAFRRGLGLGVGVKVQVKVNQNRSTCYVIGNTACEGLACEPWPPPQAPPRQPVAAPTAPARFRTRQPPPPPPLPDHTSGGGGAGNARCLTIYVCGDSACTRLCVFAYFRVWGLGWGVGGGLTIIITTTTVVLVICVYIYIYTYIYIYVYTHTYSGSICHVPFPKRYSTLATVVKLLERSKI